MTLDLRHVQTIAEETARRAAETLMTFFNGTFEQTLKGSPFDVVTEADKKAEALIVEALTAHFPEHHIVGEEGGGMGAPIEDADYRWYVDPLDGTTNFANRIPIFAVSLALADRDMNPLVGVVYVLPVGEMFSAVVGEGVTMDGKPIQVGDKSMLAQGVFASGFPYDKATDPNNNAAQWAAFLPRTRGVRRMGSAATDLVYVAAGRFDGYWEGKLNPWDCLAGALCVREAGGLVTDYDGHDDGAIFGRGWLVAANPQLHPAMLEVLASVSVPDTVTS